MVSGAFVPHVANCSRCVSAEESSSLAIGADDINLVLDTAVLAARTCSWLRFLEFNETGTSGLLGLDFGAVFTVEWVVGVPALEGVIALELPLAGSQSGCMPLERVGEESQTDLCVDVVRVDNRLARSRRVVYRLLRAWKQLDAVLVDVGYPYPFGRRTAAVSDDTHVGLTDLVSVELL